MKPFFTLCLLGTLLSSISHGADSIPAQRVPGAATNAPAKAKAAPRPEMERDHFLSFTFDVPGAKSSSLSRLAFKGLGVDLGGGAGICFDTELLRYAALWTGGFVDVRKTSMAQSPQGSGPVLLGGAPWVTTLNGPGAVVGSDFSDPRPEPRGPLPADHGKFLGFHRHGNQVILSYRVGKVEILELPGFQAESQTFTRTVQLPATGETVRLVLSDEHGLQKQLLNMKGMESDLVVHQTNGQSLHFSLRQGPSGAAFSLEGNRLFLSLPPQSKPSLFQVVLSRNNLQPRASSSAALPDLKKLIQGGPARWTTPITTQGKLGQEPGAYVVDTIAIPENNPWHTWMRLTGMDFLSDGRAAVCTLSGDVWLVSGLNDWLSQVSWKRFATGLYEPLGLKVVKDRIYVLGRDQITRLHDFNQDNEADYYECFNNQVDLYPTYHAFSMDLQTDRAGNFYFATDGNMVDPDLPLHGSVLKVSADGSQLDLIATGFRAPNGMGVGPEDQITCSDNQGHWTPSSKISWVKKGGFYGYGGDPRQTNLSHAVQRPVPTSFDPPLCWIPMNADNSSGGQIWVTSDKWGPLKNQMLHTSYGKCTLFHVMTESVGGQMQGALFQFPLKFASGIMRGRFHPLDGQLYLCGMKGWQTVAAQDGALQRVRYTGKPVQMPVAFHARTNGLEVSFSCPLEKSSASDPENYAISQWNYKWSSTYGSDSYSVVRPGQKGEDSLTVKSATLSPDGKTLFLETVPLEPVMQMRLKYNVKTGDGTELKQEIFNTINGL